MREKKAVDYVGALVGTIVGIVFVNTVLLWRQYTQGVILPTWVDTLWAANISLLVQAVGNLLLVFYRPPRFAALVQAAFAAAGLLSLIVFFIVFPLDFSGLVGQWLNTLLKALLAVGMAVTLATGVAQLVRFFLGGWRSERG
jgi:hypothetical protein